MKFIIANWKMYLTPEESARLAHDLAKKVPSMRSLTELILCPSFSALAGVSKITKRGVKFKLGAQDLFWEEGGAYTGEESARNLLDFGCKYVILGHSERRALGETDNLIAKKIKMALTCGLLPIFCIGETRAERDRGEREKVLARQIKIGLSLSEIVCRLRHKNCQKIIIAYEPVWAIGTGLPETPEGARDANVFTRSVLDKYFPALSPHIHIIYGGSVNAQNIKSFLKYQEIEGALVGGASTKLDEFIKIIKLLV